MCQIINFTTVLNSRRVVAKAAEREAKKQRSRDDRRSQGYESVAHDPLGMQVVDAICTAKEHQEDQEEIARRPMVAYCDPNNEFRGSKYEATKGLRVVEVAKLVRQDLKDAMKRGMFPKGIKFSVTSTHSKIQIKVKGAPESLKVFSQKHHEWDVANNGKWGNPFDRYTPEIQDLLDAAKKIMNAYNRDNSDSMSDYFDNRFYAFVDLCGQWERERRIQEGLT